MQARDSFMRSLWGTPCYSESKIYAQGQGFDTKLYAVIVGNPNAVLFRERMFGGIRADIYGVCGHVDLHALRVANLYQHYLRSLGEIIPLTLLR